MKIALQSIGYDMIIEEVQGKDVASEIHKTLYNELKVKTIWSVILAFPVMIIGMFFMNMLYG